MVDIVLETHTSAKDPGVVGVSETEISTIILYTLYIVHGSKNPKWSENCTYFGAEFEKYCDISTCFYRSWSLIGRTVEPVLCDHPFCPAKAVTQDRWSLITGRTKIMFYRCVHFPTQPGSKWDRHDSSRPAITCWKEEQAIYLHNNNYFKT